MKRYSSYKDSGVDWIREIPTHWGKNRIKHIVDYVNGYSFKSDDFDKEKEIPVIRIGDVGNEIDFKKCVKVDREFLESKSDFVVRKNDILIGLTGGTIGKSGRYRYETPSLLNQRVGLLRNTNKVLNGLLFYYVQSEIFMRYILFDCYGGGQDNIGMGDILQMVFPLPPISEQKQIVEYLDSKTEKIDNLIKYKEDKIELLKEQRIGLINHVVTKGLNDNVEYSSSDERWFERYPKHWDCVHFGVICNLQQGLQIPFDDRFFEKVENSYEYITTQSIHKPDQPRQYVQNPKESVICYEDDIIYGRTGNTGEVVTNVHGVFHNNFFRIDFNREVLNKDFLVWYLSNNRFREHILLLSGTTTIPDLNHGSFYSTRCLIPPLNEQEQIVNHLNERTKEIDDLILMEQKKIELLKEYRQSIISEVVTGKIRVCQEDNSTLVETI
ncbi:MAG: restriction endonuclease subunit S [Crocinitomicaceae bacterium]